jgi:hypothetical protein
MLLTFSRYLATEILGTREAKAAILEDILPILTELQGASTVQDRYGGRQRVRGSRGWGMPKVKEVHFLVEFLLTKMQKLPTKPSPLEGMKGCSW